MINNAELYKLLNAGQMAFQQNRFAEACEKFREALKIEPHNQGAQIDLGVALIRQGKFDEAQPVLVQATKDHPQAPEGWLNLATSYQSTGKVSDSIGCLRQFLKLAPNHEYAAKVRSMITLLEQDQQRRSGMKGSDTGDDYLADAAQDGVVRFAKDRRPIKIYLAPGNGVPGFKPEDDDIVRQAFSDWQAAAPNLLSFAYVPSPSEADITVSWTHDPSKMISSAEGGHAEIAQSAKGIARSDITLLTTSQGAQNFAAPNNLRHVVLHEVGHALGIAGHSPTAGDVMYGIVMPTDEVAHLSERDKHTMLALYSAAATDARPLDPSQAFTQGDDSSPAVKVVHLNNQAAQAMKAGNYPEAQAKFEQALKISPNNFEVKQNLAALYANMGSMSIMKRDMPTAESYFRKAIPILQESPDKSNLKQVLRAYHSVLMMQGKNDEASKVEMQMSTLK